MDGYVIHPSHEPIDVSDLSLTIDILCSHCKRKDEELEEICENNPNWQVTI